MSVMMPASRLMMGAVPTVQRIARATPSQQGQARPQLPVEHVAEGDVLGRHSTRDRGAASAHVTSMPASGSVTATAQRAIAEYQSFARLGKGRSVPLHNVDEYV